MKHTRSQAIEEEREYKLKAKTGLRAVRAVCEAIQYHVKLLQIGGVELSDAIVIFIIIIPRESRGTGSIAIDIILRDNRGAGGAVIDIRFQSPTSSSGSSSHLQIGEGHFHVLLDLFELTRS